MKELTHPQQGACALRRTVAKGRRMVIAIDGADGSGKTHLTLSLAARMRAAIVSMDSFLLRNRGSYVASLRLRQLRRAITKPLGLVLVEGVCVRAVLRRLHIRPIRHIYVKAMNECGTWSDESVCDFDEDIEDFLDRERKTLQSMHACLTPFCEEVIRYHAAFRPSRNAHYVFLRRPATPKSIPSLALNLAPFNRRILCDKAARRRLALRSAYL